MNEEEFDEVEEIEYDPSEFDDQGAELNEDLLLQGEDADVYSFLDEEDEEDYAIIDGLIPLDDLIDDTDESESPEDNIIEEEDEEEDEEE